MNSPVVLITGSGRERVGNVIARGLAADGYSIALHYHSSRLSAKQTAQEIREAAVDCEAFQADVTSESEVDRLFDDVCLRFGRIDALVTTSASWKKTPLETVTAADVESSFRLNALGTFLCARKAGLIMAEQTQGGSIITIGDIAIERPNCDYSAYMISKGTLPTMTRMLAVELAARNPRVRVNCLQPGPIMFPEQATAEEKRLLTESTLVRQADCPDTLTHAVKFLIENRFITGTIIPVDGGKSVYAAGEHIPRTSD
jgi:pteridine reductase